MKKRKPENKIAKNISPKASQKGAKKTCLHQRCKLAAVVDGYCRLHYISNWKTIRFNKHVKAEQRLNSYVDRLVKKYPNEYLDKIKEALESDEKFKETIAELSLENEADSTETEREFLERFSRIIKIEE